MGGDAGVRDTVARVGGRYQALNTRSAELSQFCSLQVPEICCFYGRTAGK
ncbi:hypothetical protein ACLK19_11530 [Escherichia coli]